MEDGVSGHLARMASIKGQSCRYSYWLGEWRSWGDPVTWVSEEVLAICRAFLALPGQVRFGHLRHFKDQHQNLATSHCHYI